MGEAGGTRYVLGFKRESPAPTSSEVSPHPTAAHRVLAAPFPLCCDGSALSSDAPFWEMCLGAIHLEPAGFA